MAGWLAGVTGKAFGPGRTFEWIEMGNCFASNLGTILFKKRTTPGLFFFIFVFSIQLTVNIIQ